MKKILKYYSSTNRAVFWINKFIKYSDREKENFFRKVSRALIRNKLHKKYNILISNEAKIGKNITFPHPQNIVIGSGVEIGDNCVIFHEVTLGQNKKKYPVVEDDVVIYPGAKIIGGIRVKKGSVIGANAVVIRDVQENTVVAGNPAKEVAIRSLEDELY